MLNKSEILKVAASIEEAGIEFYREAKSKVSEEMKEVFDFLIKEEMKHRELFEEMLRGTRDFTIAHQLTPEDYDAYVKAIGYSAVFKKEELELKMNNAKDIITFAIEMEKRSIDYYTFLKKMVSPEDHPLINQLIKEEQNHYAQLSSILEKMNK
ncbi:MAG: ferritin family protein [Candidatus Hydrothermia bacterium]